MADAGRAGGGRTGAPPFTFGLAVTNEEPFEDLLVRVRRLDAGDAVDRLWVADERFRRDPWVTLGVLAAATTRLGFATAVTDPYIRHPALTATAMASVADAAGGRETILGLGAGASGFGALGIERPGPATAIREQIELSRRLWAEREAFSYAGKQIRFTDSRMGFTPPGPIPIWVAGRGPQILELAGELADGVLVASFVGGPLLEHSLARVAAGEARRRAGLAPLERGSWAYVAIDPDRAAARGAVRTGIAVALWGSRPIIAELGIELPAELTRLMAETAYSVEPEVIGRAAALVPEHLIDDCSIAGTADEVAAKVQRLTRHGISHLAAWLFPTRNRSLDAMVDDYVEEVIPRVRRAGG